VMQLPPTDVLVLVSGLAPIRAKKLRYYEDRNFTFRILPAPELSEAGYADRPPVRPDGWLGQVRETDAGLEVAASSAFAVSEEEEGGLQRHPGLPGEGDIVRPSGDERADDLAAVLNDDPDNAAQSNAKGIDPLRPPSAVQRAYGVNAGEDFKGGRRGADQDLLPGF
jgi:type IV secretion system protein VirD4